MMRVIDWATILLVGGFSLYMILYSIGLLWRGGMTDTRFLWMGPRQSARSLGLYGLVFGMTFFVRFVGTVVWGFRNGFSHTPW